MARIAALSHEQLVAVVQEIRDALYLSESITESGREITVPLTDELAITGSDAADAVVEILERYELTPRADEPAPTAQGGPHKSSTDLAKEAAFLAGVEAFHSGKKATPAQDPAVIQLMKKYRDQPWGIGSSILDGWISGWHQANVRSASAAVGGEAAAIAVSGFRAFDEAYVDPTLSGNRGLKGRSKWFMLEQLQTALTDAGRAWFSARTEKAPELDDYLPTTRRLWCSDDNPIDLLHHTDECLAIACGDDGQLAEIWATPSAEAYAASHGISIERAEEELGTAWENILDHAQRMTGCTMVEGFTIADGRRDANLGLG